jgi:thioredoxin-related protein
MSIKTGALLYIKKGLYPDMPYEYPDGAWLIEDITLIQKFIPEGTPVLILEKKQGFKRTYKGLIGDQVFLIVEKYLKEL